MCIGHHALSWAQFGSRMRLLLCWMTGRSAVWMSETSHCLGNTDVLPVTIKRDVVAAVVRQPLFYRFSVVEKCPKGNSVFCNNSHQILKTSF